MCQILLGVYLISSLDGYSHSADSNYALAQSISIQLVKDKIRKNGNRGKSMIVGLAGGNIKTMMNAIPEDNGDEDDEEEDDEDDDFASKSLISFGGTTIDALKDSIRSMFSYGSVHSYMQGSEDFDA